MADARDICEGELLCHEPTLSADGQKLNEPGTGSIILAVFHHRGRVATHVRLGLADGTYRGYSANETVRVAIKQDFLERWRPEPRDSYGRPNVDAPDMLALTSAIWDEQIDSGSAVPQQRLEAMLGWPADRLQHSLEEGRMLNLILTKKHGRRKGTPLSYALSDAGIIVLASCLRAVGIEIFSEAEEQK